MPITPLRVGSDRISRRMVTAASLRYGRLSNMPVVPCERPSHGSEQNPAKGIWVFGGYGLAPMSIIEAKDGLIAFDTGDTRHDGELMLKAIRTVSRKPIKVIIYGHSHTVFPDSRHKRGSRRPDATGETFV